MKPIVIYNNYAAIKVTDEELQLYQKNFTATTQIS